MDVGVIMEFWHPASLMQISELIKVSIPSLWWPWDELGKPSCFRNKGGQRLRPPVRHLLPLYRHLQAQILRMGKYPLPGITGLG